MKYISFVFQYFQVTEGKEIAVIEAMKMQNAILAHKNGKIKSVHTKINDKIGDGDIIIEYEI